MFKLFLTIFKRSCAILRGLATTGSPLVKRKIPNESVVCIRPYTMVLLHWLHLRDPAGSKLACGRYFMGKQTGCGIQKLLTIVHVHLKTEVLQEIWAEYTVCHIGDQKYPPESSLEAPKKVRDFCL